MIVAPDAVIHTWREEAERLLAASKRPADPALLDALRFIPREVEELVVYLSEALAHASGILLGSAVNATPGGPEMLRNGLKALVDEVAAEQARDHGLELDGPCPIPEFDGSPHECTCGPEGRRTCTRLRYDIDLDARLATAGDDGCEGGRA